MAAASDLHPGPAYVWGRLGTRAEYIKIMIDSGNTVGDLVSEEFAERLGLEGDDIQDPIAVPTEAAATTLLALNRLWRLGWARDRLAALALAETRRSSTPLMERSRNLSDWMRASRGGPPCTAGVSLL